MTERKTYPDKLSRYLDNDGEKTYKALAFVAILVLPVSLLTACA